MEFQRIERELEHSRRIYLAWKYIAALNVAEKNEENVKVVQNKIDSKAASITAGKNEIEEIEKKLAELQKQMEAV